ncbi:MAG: hypothetical protein C4334_09925 [Pyrinomonas sp.]|uniref:energy transducer TonB n=1 Tax=Pyrinomonas sp. TaxID=2080306 RepID=UPI0033343FBD
MISIAKRLLPFIIALLLGVALAGAFNALRFGACSKSKRAPVAPGALSAPSCPSMSSSYTPVRILDKPVPRYTEQARYNGTTGTTRLRARFNADGTISNIEPLTTLPDGLTEEAISAAQNIKFLPATENGRPVSVVKLLEYGFEIY